VLNVYRITAAFSRRPFLCGLSDQSETGRDTIGERAEHVGAAAYLPDIRCAPVKSNSVRKDAVGGSPFLAYPPDHRGCPGD